jgi:hypothetical protein
MAPGGKQCTKQLDGMPYPCLEGLLPYERLGLWHEVRSGQARKNKRRQSYRPPSVHVPAMIARSDRFAVGQASWESRCARPMSARVDAPTEQAMPKARRGRGTSASRHAERGSLHAVSGKRRRFGDRPWRVRTLDHRFCRGAMGGVGATSCHSSRLVPIAPLIRRPLTLPGPPCGRCGW